MGLDIEDHLDEVIEVVKLHLLPLLLIFIVLMTSKEVKQTKFERNAFYWFLFNGAILRITWDGFVGGLHQCDPLFRAYSTMDLRYKSSQNLVKIVSLIDLFINGPLCLVCARLYINSRGIKRDLLAIIVSLVQIITTLFYVFDEVSNKFENVCPENSCFTFTGENIGFFWICFVLLNPIWILVPLYIIIVASSNITAQDRWTFQTCAIENGTGGEHYYSDYDKSEKNKAKKIKKE